MADGTPASTIQLIGAGCFGAILGWYLYYVNRYRSGTVDFGDITTIATTIGGAAVLALFPSGTDMFGAYGIGLAIILAASYWLLTTIFGAIGQADLLPAWLAAWATNLLFIAFAGYMVMTVRT